MRDKDDSTELLNSPVFCSILLLLSRPLIIIIKFQTICSNREDKAVWSFAQVWFGFQSARWDLSSCDVVHKLTNPFLPWQLLTGIYVFHLTTTIVYSGKKIKERLHQDVLPKLLSWPVTKYGSCCPRCRCCCWSPCSRGPPPCRRPSFSSPTNLEYVLPEALHVQASSVGASAYPSSNHSINKDWILPSICFHRSDNQFFFKLMLSCRNQFMHAFYALYCVLELIALVNKNEYVENKPQFGKRMRKRDVATVI